MRYPWIQGAWTAIVENLDRLPPAIMFVGPRGLGKLDLALDVSAALLCTEGGKDGGACGRCDACQKAGKGLHPDLHFLTSEGFAATLRDTEAQMASRYLETKQGQRAAKKPRQVITVDQVRVLIHNLVTHSHGSGPRIALIAPASSLNINAANALLKILEEPPGDARFILVTGSRDMLPATIVSRVSVVECHAPPVEEGAAWLIEQGVPDEQCRELIALASGAPVAALNLYREGYADAARHWRRNLARLVRGQLLPLPMAAEIGSDAGRFLFWLERLLGDTLRAAYGRDASTLLVGEGEADRELASQLILRPQ